MASARSKKACARSGTASESVWTVRQYVWEPVWEQLCKSACSREGLFGRERRSVRSLGFFARPSTPATTSELKSPETYSASFEVQ